MSHPRQYQMVGGGGGGSGGGGGGGNASQFGDTTHTKIFVGGLAWETHRETLKRYFEQFGEILEAVVITDKASGKSKGYGFVTFKDPDSAMRACQDPSPVIDGRRANCNIASLGAHKSRPSPPPHHARERLRPASGSMGKATHRGSSANFRQSSPHFLFPPYSVYGYSGHPQELYAMNYYNVYDGQQLSSYYSHSLSGSPGVYYSYYPVYTQQGQGSQMQGFGIQYPYLPQSYQAVGILPLPASSSSASASTSPSMAATATATATASATAIASAATAAGDVTKTAAAASDRVHEEEEETQHTTKDREKKADSVWSL